MFVSTFVKNFNYKTSALNNYLYQAVKILSKFKDDLFMHLALKVCSFIVVSVKV